MSAKNIPSNERLIFAMDVPDADRARALAEQLGDAVQFYKLGLELLMSGGYFQLIDWLAASDKKIFVDLKFFDVPATVGRAVARLRDRGVTFATVHGNQSIILIKGNRIHHRSGHAGINGNSLCSKNTGRVRGDVTANQS